MPKSLDTYFSGTVAIALVFTCFTGCDQRGSVAEELPAANDRTAEHDAVQDTEREAERHAKPTGPKMPDYLVNAPRIPRNALSKALADGLLDVQASTKEKLASVLKAAGVAEESQVLVFSKTSLQHRLISPSNPRAIYFNDDCYIGYVPGGIVEYGDADPDPKVGSGLFALDMRDGLNASLTFDTDCMSCHSGSRTNGRAGFLIRSVFPDEKGFPITSAGSTLVGHDTPIDKRWGGWYVTGQSGNTHHRGNQTATELPNGDAQLDNAVGSNLADLSPFFGTTRYLRPASDIVALLVLEHQVIMHNVLTQGASSVHDRINAAKSLAKHLEEPYDPAKNDTLQRVIASNAKKIVKQLLYAEEVALTDPVVGDEAFQDAFRANRKEDKQGRSLKDFDLQTRMFKYRCSYMVYSRAFELMPDMLKDAVLAKLKAVLQGEDDDSTYDHLDDQERKAILTILQETNVL